VQAFAPAAKGKIVIYDRPRGGPKRSPKLYAQLRASLQSMKDAGALAVLMPSNESLMNNVVSTGSMDFGGKLGALPAASIGYEDGKMLVRALDRAPVTVELDLPNQVSGTINLPNVIGEIRGKDKPDEWIIVGAHLDSWDFATGSQDNGAGVVQVLEVARALIAAGPLRRSVRFAFWGGEEQGLNGSRAYVMAHEAELGKCVAYLNTDNGAGHVKGWKVEGRKDLRKALEPFAQGVLAGAGGTDLEMTLTMDTDHFPFVLVGVPALDLLVDGGNYEQVHHQMSDTVDKVDSHSLQSGAAVVALTAGWLAMAPEPIAPRLDHAGIEEVLKQEEGVLEMLKARGFWK
jgi:Iap family predicted aminopeptidase